MSAWIAPLAKITRVNLSEKLILSKDQNLLKEIERKVHPKNIHVNFDQNGLTSFREYLLKKNL